MATRLKKNTSILLKKCLLSDLLIRSFAAAKLSRSQPLATLPTTLGHVNKNRHPFHLSIKRIFVHVFDRLQPVQHPLQRRSIPLPSRRRRSAPPKLQRIVYTLHRQRNFDRILVRFLRGVGKVVEGVVLYWQVGSARGSEVVDCDIAL